MSEFKGTKGEWFSCCTNAKPHFLFANYGETTICSFYQKQDDGNILSTEEIRANAKLIACAPEMFKEIKETIIDLKIIRYQILDALKTNHLFEGMPETIDKWIKIKEQLIKKATE